MDALYMKLYLARHGEAERQEVDPRLPLSKRGKKDIEMMAQFLIPLEINVSHIFHSGILRAQETAEILAQSIHSEHPLKIWSALEPLGPIAPVASDLNGSNTDILLVGHLPFMGKLASQLISGDENEDITVFNTGTLICLERVGSTRWILRWALCPELLNNRE